jgi:delta-aminolevulinic acid dehydratase/porphobilinogen synthase
MVQGGDATLGVRGDDGISDAVQSDREALVLETLTSFKRAGCSVILTYHAAHAARLLNA